jgi:hypothetical protein
MKTGTQSVQPNFGSALRPESSDLLKIAEKSKRPNKRKAKTLLGIRVLESPCKLPDGWIGCFIALKPDGTIDTKRSGVLKQ